MSLSLGHTNPDDLTGGIHPFITSYRDQHTKATLEQAVANYEQVTQGAGAHLTDLEHLRKAEKVGLPLSMVETTYALLSFRVLLQALLPEDHPMVRAYTAFIQAWRREEITLSYHSVSPLAFGQMLRFVQIRISHWFSQQLITPEAVTPPDLMSLITKIKHHQPWQPPLPTELLPTTSHPISVPLSPLSPSPPTPPATGGGADKDNGRGARVTNTKCHAAFKDFKDLGLSLKTVRDKAKEANVPIPQNAKQTEHCLSYHVAGFCWNNCARREDHRQHSPTEHKTLLEWCKKCYREGGPQ